MYIRRVPWNQNVIVQLLFSRTIFSHPPPKQRTTLVTFHPSCVAGIGGGGKATQVAFETSFQAKWTWVALPPPSGKSTGCKAIEVALVWNELCSVEFIPSQTLLYAHPVKQLSTYGSQRLRWTDIRARGCFKWTEVSCCVGFGSRENPASHSPLLAAPQLVAVSAQPDYRSGVRLKHMLYNLFSPK